jgi:hypothetical protein
MFQIKLRITAGFCVHRGGVLKQIILEILIATLVSNILVHE